MKIERLILEPLDNNTYILSCEKDAIIIDPSDEKEKIESYIKTNKLELKALLITHYHYDHIGSLEYFKNKYNLEVFDYEKIGKQKVGLFKFETIPTKGHSMDSVSFILKIVAIYLLGTLYLKAV